MTPSAAAVRGGLAGFAGAALAQASSSFIVRHGGGDWLHGPYGTPFLGVALYTGVFYGTIGAALGRRAAAAGFLGGFLGLAVPLYVLTRYGGWASQQWVYAMLILYTLVTWGTIAGIGLAARGKSWRAAAAAMLGSMAGYAVLAGCLAIFRGSPVRNASRRRPPFVNLLDGLFSGAGLCLALSLDEHLSRRTS